MTEQVTDRDSIVRGSRFTIAWETSSDNAVYVTMTLLLIQDQIQENEWTATCKLRIETALSEEVASLQLPSVRFECEHCKKKFSMKSALNIHNYIHIHTKAKA